MKTKEMIERICGRSQTLCLTLCAMMFAGNALADPELSTFLDSRTSDFSYDSSTKTYTLLRDVNFGEDFGIGQNYRFDLNGHSLSIHYGDGGTGTGEYTVEFQNSAAKRADVSLSCFGGSFIFGNGVRLGQSNMRCGVKRLVFKSGSSAKSSGLVLVGGLGGGWSDLFYECDWSLLTGAEIILEPGVKVSQEGLEQILSRISEDARESFSSSYGITWGGVVDVLRNYLPDGCVFIGPDADGYYTVTPRFEEVVKDEKEFDIDTRTSPRNVELASEILPFAHRVNGWGAGSATNATITYTFNGGAAQTLGSYADEDAAVWKPAKNGTYVFTHQPGGLTSTFNVQIPTVTLLSAQQRYPWNNIVDYKYELNGLMSDKTYKLAVELTAKGTTKGVTNDVTTKVDGTYTGTVDALPLLGTTGVDKNGSIELKLLIVK